MRDNWDPDNEKKYEDNVSEQTTARRIRKANLKRNTGLRRRQLARKQREAVLNKTDGRRYVCGSDIEGQWQADHVLSNSKGGDHSVENYLLVHRTCSNFRWDCTPHDFEEIMKYGIRAQTHIIRQSVIGMSVEQRFVKHEIDRIKRRK